MVICSQLWTEGLLLLEITLRKGQKLVQPFAVMVAAYRLVQPPPDQLHGVGLRAPRRQRIQAYSPSARLEVFLHPSAGVAQVVVYGQVQPLIMAAVGLSEWVFPVSTVLPK